MFETDSSTAAGQSLYPLAEGETRPRLEPETYGKRNLKTNMGIFIFGFEWKSAGKSVIDTFRTTFFPTIMLMVVLNVGFFVVSSGSGQTITFGLLAAGSVHLP